MPGERPRTYSVYVDEKDKVWLTDFGGNAIVRFDPVTNEFNSFPSDKPNANVRQMDGKPGQAWGGESGTNRLIMIETLHAAGMIRIVAGAALLSFAFATGAAAEDGAALFEPCRACHSLDPAAKVMPGPNLAGLHRPQGRGRSELRLFAGAPRRAR